MAKVTVGSCIVDLEARTITSERRVSANEKAKKAGEGVTVKAIVDLSKVTDEAVFAAAFSDFWISFQSQLRKEMPEDGEEVTFDPTTKKTSSRLSKREKARRALCLLLDVSHKATVEEGGVALDDPRVDKTAKTVGLKLV